MKSNTLRNWKVPVRAQEKVDIKNMTLEELTAYLAGKGKERFRAKQIMQWIYRHGATSFDVMTTLSRDLRSELESSAIVSNLETLKVEKSEDGTKKYLFQLSDGETVETVRIPMEKDRATLCVSTQVGCGMGCTFCLTGTMGLKRNLLASEIVNQVCEVMKDEPVNNIVFMGMGEPLQNLDNLGKALDILHMEEGFDFSSRRMTVSTCGLVPEIRRMGESFPASLAISLNATTNDLRDRLMPINRRYPLEELMAVCREYPLKPRQRITFEYILIRDLNDTLADAKRLVRLLHGIKAKVNLIPFNEHPGTDFQSPDEDKMEVFQTYLLDHGLVAVRRASRGRDISAACGQLKGLTEERASIAARA
jgi:23S rRNA (adenine2503-C2)-methyltransferase